MFGLKTLRKFEPKNFFHSKVKTKLEKFHEISNLHPYSENLTFDSVDGFGLNKGLTRGFWACQILW